jgi:uncharacterized protein YbbC (DUF1343 family)
MTGLERLLTNPERLGAAGLVGLLTNPTGVTRDLEPAAAALLRAGIRLERLLAPEHGIDGSGQAGEAPEREQDALTGLPVHTTYGRKPPEIVPMLHGLDTLLVDIQDVGCRFYTYPSTLAYALEACQTAGVRLVVLDRPNPLGSGVSGPVLQAGLESFVGITTVPLQHGLTLGEIARYMAGGWDGLTVIPCDPLEPFGVGGLPWVPPSPNIPDLETARLYPGLGLIEGSDLSEGRGTTRPFGWIGAPGLDAHKMARDLNALELPGMRFRPVFFTPTISKHAGTLCAGVQVHVTGQLEDVVRMGLSVLAVARGQGVNLKLEWLRKLLGVPIKESDVQLEVIPDLCQTWNAQARAYSSAMLAPIWMYPR